MKQSEKPQICVSSRVEHPSVSKLELQERREERKKGVASSTYLAFQSIFGSPRISSISLFFTISMIEDPYSSSLLRTASARLS